MHLRASLVALVLLAACAHGPRGPDGQPLWVEAESEHFVLRADLSAEDVRASIEKLEQIRQGLLVSSWSAKTQPPAKTHVILLADLDELNEYVRRGIDGFATSDPFDAPLLVATAETSLEDVTVLKHEMAHQVDNVFLLRQPRWLSEGLASYLETIQLARDGSSVTVGKANLDRFNYLRRYPVVDLKWVMAQGPGIYSQSREEANMFYSQSWLLVDYLANRRRQAFSAWLARLARAEDPAASFATVFAGISITQLENEVHEYMNSGSFTTMRFPLPPLNSTVTLRPLSAADARAELALLRSLSFGQATAGTAARAATEAEQALRADPQSPLAAGVWFATGKRSRDEQIAVARAVVAGHPDDSRGFELLGIALGASAGTEQADALETALRLAPGDARVLANLSFNYLTQQRGQEGLIAAQKSVQLAPGNPSYLDNYAVALANTGHCTEAPLMERRAIEMVPEGAAAIDVAKHLERRISEFDQMCSASKQGSSIPLVAVEEGTTPPRSAGACKPRKSFVRPPDLKPGTVLHITFVISPEGKPIEVKLNGTPPAAVLKSVREYIEGCPFTAARGPHGTVRWPMSVNFTFAQ